MSGRDYDEDLAYGEDYRNRPQEGSSERGFVGDTFNRLKTQYQQRPQGQSQPYPPGNQQYSGQQPPGQSTASYGYDGHNQPYPQQPGQPSYGRPPSRERPDLVSKLFSGLQSTVHSIGTDVAGLLGTQYPSQPQSYGQYPQQGTPSQTSQRTRFGSFASEKFGNEVKWYVDGAGYFNAVSNALDGARESIWILDWWLSPELYLRRPPSKNEQYRLDRMLQRAAQRGVRVNVVVYKEVTQALTLSSSHTKHALEALHPNIAVMRHPDHLPDPQAGGSTLASAFEGLSLDAAGASQMGADDLKALYGFDPQDSTVLYWAHHEKLLIVDSSLVFMGGLDLCFGRWDLNQHPIADAHGADLEMIIWPGQDYNDNRVLDFQNVAQPFQNKLDRTKSSRMGWSDVSICLQGPVVNDLRYHFVNRWNFIFHEKYNRGDPRYTALSMLGRPASSQGPSPQYNPPPQQHGSSQPPHTPYGNTAPQFAPPPGSQQPSQPAWQSTNRPHTPEYSGGAPSQQPNIQSSGQAGPAPSQLYPPPPGSQSTYQSQAPWQRTSRPHTPEPAPAATQVYQQTPQSHPPAGYQSYQQYGSQGITQQQPYYPPPPPGAPPQMWASQQPPASSHMTSPSPVYQAYNPQAPHHPSELAELPTSQPAPGLYTPAQGFLPPPTQTSRGLDEPLEGGEQFSSDRGFGDRFGRYRQDGQALGGELQAFGNMLSGQLQSRVHGSGQHGRPSGQARSAVSCQVVRSCTKWSNGTPTEHSVQEAYIETILSAQHFIYIENQFFITATGEHQHPVKNQIGKALVDRILRAARNREPFKVIVVIPSVPGFAGDLRDKSSLGTRAIMDFQYKSINRGGHSIMELIAKEGFNPMDYIRFYNLRNYDRINVDNMMRQIEELCGVRYEDARKEHDDLVGAGYGGQGEQTGISPGHPGSRYQQYQAAARRIVAGSTARWDTVSGCYMLGGTDIRSVPWDGPPEAEIDAFVSEELYIHTKALIADDRVVICGSANLNDRSQLGSRDSEIALVIADSTPLQSSMAGRPWQASRFAASLRRQLMRKHLGLLKPQDLARPDANFELVGVPNAYDWGSPEDNIVSDPLSDAFQSLWNSRARTNTEVFRKVFHVVPDDNIHTWSAYREFYEYFFHDADLEAQGKDEHGRRSRYEWGHVVREDFPGGVKEVKEWLSRVKGTVVEMPLTFLQSKCTPCVIDLGLLTRLR